MLGCYAAAGFFGFAECDAHGLYSPHVGAQGFQDSSRAGTLWSGQTLCCIG
jgi:hypothetical protein